MNKGKKFSLICFGIVAVLIVLMCLLLTRETQTEPNTTPTITVSVSPTQSVGVPTVLPTVVPTVLPTVTMAPTCTPTPTPIVSMFVGIEPEYSIQVGDDTHLEFHDNGTVIVLTGKGVTWDLDEDFWETVSMPRFIELSDVSMVIIDKGITQVGSHVIYSLPNVSTIMVFDTLKVLKSLSFCNVGNMDTVWVGLEAAALEHIADDYHTLYEWDNFSDLEIGQ